MRAFFAVLCSAINSNHWPLKDGWLALSAGLTNHVRAISSSHWRLDASGSMVLAKLDLLPYCAKTIFLAFFSRRLSSLVLGASCSDLSSGVRAGGRAAPADHARYLGPSLCWVRAKLGWRRALCPAACRRLPLQLCAHGRDLQKRQAITSCGPYCQAETQCHVRCCAAGLKEMGPRNIRLAKRR